MNILCNINSYLCRLDVRMLHAQAFKNFSTLNILDLAVVFGIKSANV